MMGECSTNSVEAALLPPTASLGIKTPSPQRSSAFENLDAGHSGSAVVNNVLMSRLMEMIHRPCQSTGQGAGPENMQTIGGRGNGNQLDSSSLRLDCELTGSELKNINSRLVHEVTSGNSSSGSRSPATQARCFPAIPASTSTAGHLQMSSPFGAPNLQRNASANLGVSTPDQAGESKFLACPI